MDQGDHDSVIDDDSYFEKVPEPDLQGIRLLANLFGISLPENEKQQESQTSIANALETVPAEQPIIRTGSSPIKMNRQLQISPPSPNNNTFLSGMSSVQQQQQQQQPPDDWIDSEGHIWRAKYCVLYSNILYFYTSQEDAESPRAKAEREQTTEGLLNPQSPGNNNNHHVPDATTYLSRSPMPSKSIIINGRKSDVLCEKQVALTCVGAVRCSAEYGENTFELVAAGEADDKLILRAPSEDEMKDWLLSFHLAISQLLETIVECALPRTTTTTTDLEYPRYKNSIGMEDQQSPHNLATAFLSPRYPIADSAGTALSHGHGRSSLHRRRSAESPPSFHSDSRPRSESRCSSEETIPSPTLPFPIDQLSTPRRVVVSPLIPTAREEVKSSFSPEQTPDIGAIQFDSKAERPPKPQGKYVPPGRRPGGKNNSSTIQKQKHVPSPLQQSTDRYVPRHARAGQEREDHKSSHEFVIVQPLEASSEVKRRGEMQPWEIDEDDHDDGAFRDVKRGGCADPEFVKGSILDERYRQRKASRLKKVRTPLFGYSSFSDDDAIDGKALRWEIGAFSECGIRETNEDSFLVTSNIVEMFRAAQHTDATIWDRLGEVHPTGLFAIFDGHCGDEASRFAAEMLPKFIYEQSLNVNNYHMNEELSDLAVVQKILDKALRQLDKVFCAVCTEENRLWDSGSTALVAVLVKEHLVIGNLGDARGIMGRSVVSDDAVAFFANEGWNELLLDKLGKSKRYFLWKQVTEVHSPSRDDEKSRIERANGWVTTEEEMPFGQLQRMALYDDDVIDILKRCFASRYDILSKASVPNRVMKISRVCGELAVSRSLGDRDFKAYYNNSMISTSPDAPETRRWDSSHLFLSYPHGHDQQFIGDLISNQPEFQIVQVGLENVSEEFLLLACDGFWDVIDADDAYRVTHDLLFEKKWTARKAAGRLAELAVHLGSADNITVIVVRFFDRTES
jgi:serine/threonine protein phosphatase PrpC